MALTSQVPVENLLLRLLREEIRKQLTAALMEVAEEIIAPAVDKALAEMEPQVQRFYSAEHMGDLVKVIVERKSR